MSIHEPLTILFYHELCQTLHRDKVKKVGNRVGKALAAKHTAHLAPFPDGLSVMKWIAKDLWSILFRKNASQLKTDRKNIFVIEDTEFKWIQATPKAAAVMEFAMSVLKGAIEDLFDLQSLTYHVNHPHVSFHVHLQGHIE